MLSKYGKLNTAVTPEQQAALDKLNLSTTGIPTFGTDASGAVSKMFGSSTDPQIGMLNAGLGGLKGSLGGIADPANLNPMNTPGLSDALKTMTNDITNQTKGVYAGSGRDPSGAGSFAGSLSRGLTQGLAPVITNQYNANVGNLRGAANDIFGGTGSTASGITGQQQVPLTNAAQAIGLLPSAAGAYTIPGATALGAANASYQQPYGNLAQLLGPLTNIAGLGGQSTGQGTSTTTQPQSTLGNIIGGASLLSAFMPSDKRLKENIKEVGKLHDGQKVYKFNLKTGGPTQIGLLAQNVKKSHPESIGMLGGMMGVDYDSATKGAERAA